MPVASRRRPMALFLGLIVLCALTLTLALALSGHPVLAGVGGAGATGEGGAGPKAAHPTTHAADPSRAMPFETAPEPQTYPPSGSPNRQGGPDEFGYVFSDNRDPGGPAYSWRTATQRVPDSAWTLVRNVQETEPWDDGVVTNTLPFAFSMYGVNYTQVRIATNGNVHFGAPNDYWPQASNQCIPSTSQYVPRGISAPLWYDFVVPLITDTIAGGVYYDVQGSAPNRVYIVEWRNVYQYDAPNIRATFQVLLHETGEMVYQYQAFNGPGVTGSRGVVGIQNADGNIGLPYLCYQDDLAPERAIRYRIQQGVILQPGDRTAGGAPGGTVTITETVYNQTGIDNSFNLSTSGETWTTTVQPANTGTIPRGGSAQVSVAVQIPPSVPLGAFDRTTLLAASTLPAPGQYTDTAVLTTTASTLGADINPPSQSRPGDFGTPITYSMSLVNRSGLNNTFALALTGADWVASVIPQMTGNLPPGASTPVTVSVLVPTNASLTSRDVLTLTATGQQPVVGQFFGQAVLTATAGLWHHETGLPTGRSRGAAVAFPQNGRIYVLGGEYNNGSTGMPVEEFDPLAHTWTQRANLQTGVSNVGAAVIGDAIYIPGGYGGTPPAVRTTLQVYNPLQNLAGTITTDPLPAPRFGAGVAALNGKLYVIGGMDEALVAHSTVFEYDPTRPAGSRWQTRAPMPTARVYLGAAALGGLVYAVGGIPGNFTDLATVEAYDPGANTWTTRQPMSTPRGGLAVVGVEGGAPGCGGYLFALGGGWANYTAAAERYDPAANAWEPITALPVARRTLFATYSPSTYALIAAGGWDGTYSSRVDSIHCSGGLQPPTPTPTVPVTPSPMPSCTIAFADVPVDNTFYPFVRCLACQGIVSGYACGGTGEPCNPTNDPYFRPNAYVTRGQLAKIVSESAGFSEEVPPSQWTFTDVPYGSTFWLWVERLANREVMAGYACGGPGEPCDSENRPYFRPGAGATRGQLTKIVSNSANFTDTIPPDQYSFTDVPPTHTFWLYVQRLLLNRPGVMAGYACGSDPAEPCDPQDRPYFRPNNPLTRGQTAKIVGTTFFPACNPFRP
jgi:hypothetical protein